MKRISSFMAVCTLFVFMLLSLQEIKYKDHWEWEKAPSEATLMLNFSYAEVHELTAVHVLTDLADHYQANIELITNRTIDDKYVLYHAIYLTHDYPINRTLISGRNLNISDMYSNYFVASFATGDTMQVGMYEDLFNDDWVYYYPLVAYVNQYNLNGQIFVSFLDSTNQEMFIDELCQSLHVDREQIVSDITAYSLQPSSINFLGMLAIIFFIGFLLLLGFYILKQSKKISVLKLNGFGQMDINKLLLKPIFIPQFILIIWMISIAWIRLPSIGFDLTKKITIVFCTSTLTSLALIQLIQSHISLALLIKNADYRSFYTSISFLAKIFMALICAYILGICLTNLDYSWSLQKEMKIWKPYLSTVTVHSYWTDDTSWNKNLNLFSDSTSIAAFYSDIYDYSYLVYPNTFKYKDKEFNYLMASENYLQKYRFYDNNDNLLTFDPDLQQPLILVPLSMNDLNYHDCLMINHYKDPLIVYYDDQRSDDVFSYDPFFAQNNHYKVINPVISVKTKNNMVSEDYDYLINNGTLKFPNPDSLDRVMSIYKERLSAKPILETYQEAFEDKLSLVDRMQKIYLPMFLLTTIIYIFLLYQMTHIYVTNEAKKLAVYYTLGYSTLRSVLGYLTMIIMTWMFSVTGYYLGSLSQFSEWNLFRFIEYELSPIVLLGIWIFCLFELLILVAILFWIKRQSFVIYLKGGN